MSKPMIRYSRAKINHKSQFQATIALRLCIVSFTKHVWKVELQHIPYIQATVTHIKAATNKIILLPE